MAWTDSPARGAYVADCGPYVGPWPPAPPIPANLPAEVDCAELDYYITTDSLADVVARTGLADRLNVGRWYTDDTPPTAASSGIGSTPIVGGNLFLIFFGPGYSYPFGPPAVGEFTLVPSLYVAGGTGSPVSDPTSGSWSPWTDYPPDLIIDSIGVGFTNDATIFGSASVAGSSAMPAAEAAALTAALAATPGYSFGPVASFQGTGGQGVTGASASADLVQTNASIPEGDTAFDFMPYDIASLLQSTPLIEGVDYAADPGTGLPGEMASAGTAFVGWNELHINGTENAGVEAHAEFSSLAFRFAAISGVYTPSVAADGAGAGLGNVTVTAPASGSAVTLTADASGIDGTAPFYVNCQVEGYSTIPEWISQLVATSDELVNWALSLSGSTITANVAYPQYRYWIPGGLAWRPFVAGAFETGSGVTLYINTPGLGLVPVMDGPG